MTQTKIVIGFLLFPRLTQLDLTGPYEVFASMPGAEVHLIARTRDPVRSDSGLAILPTVAFGDCPPLDVIMVPGGPGQIEVMDDEETLSFLRRVAADCRLVTSVCTGSLVLAAAGLLQGYRATCHWASRDQLGLIGVEPVAERVVHDRDRFTGGGVTSGIDFALSVVAALTDAATAQTIQLQIEYNPQPPFDAGSPSTAPAAVVEKLRAAMAPMLARRRAATERAAARLGIAPLSPR